MNWWQSIRTSRTVRMFSVLMTCLAGLSVFAILHHGYQFGVPSAIAVMLDWYNKLLDVLLRWLEPLVNELLDKLPWDLKFQNPAWRHLFVFFALLVQLMIKGQWRYHRRVKVSLGETIRTNIFWIPIYIALILLVGVLPASNQFHLRGLSSALVFFLFVIGSVWFLMGHYLPRYPQYAPEGIDTPGAQALVKGLGGQLLAILAVTFAMLICSAGFSLLGL